MIKSTGRIDWLPVKSEGNTRDKNYHGVSPLGKWALNSEVPGFGVDSPFSNLSLWANYLISLNPIQDENNNIYFKEVL